DHGKSAIVKALTGTDPDRLAEEQRRGMTIDLGFAHFDLPGDRRVGVVDVPGHERLIRNMLAGATGIDLVMLVVAADEGVMPQTREHLDILRFLPVQKGLVVLNKVDLVTDPAWLALVMDDVQALTKGTFLEGAPVVRVSARTGEGVPELVGTLDRLLDAVVSHAADAPVRLPIDRAFVMAGFGTVVTGTLWAGRIRRGDDLEVLPLGRRLRVRGLQTHGHDMDAVTAGSRAAVNVVGADKSEIARGDVLVTPGAFRPTVLIDARVRLLPDARPLAHLARIRLYVGSAEVLGRTVLLDRSKLEPGQTADVQLRLEEPAVVAAGDPFVLRLYSPMVTIGGGTVINPYAPKRRRGVTSASEIAQAAASSSDRRMEDLVRAAASRGITLEDLARDAGLSRGQADDVIGQLSGNDRVLTIRDRVFHRDAADRLAGQILQAVDAFHEAHPWRIGIPRDELKAAAYRAGDDRFYAAVLASLAGRGEVIAEAGFVRRPGHHPQRAASDLKARAALESALAAGGASPPDRQHLEGLASDERAFAQAFQSLLDDGTVIETAPGVYFHKDAIAKIKQTVEDAVAKNGSITVAVLRDTLQTSRKFALTVLEYFDTIKLTRRIGDKRVLTKQVTRD
ncbi:MAG TPA: selenocysteine-specific translation elongation factor, partial [bacterium]